MCSDPVPPSLWIVEGQQPWTKTAVDITHRLIGDLTILGLHGRLTVSAAETEILPICTAIASLLADGRVHVALDLSHITHIDARGLGELVLADAALRRCGGELTLIAPSDRVKRLLSVTRLDAVFAQRASERAA